ncbi:hypothetical protein DPMN_051338 [Dreissena polymorpha]|uniref:Endonuclease/exonuclease/phosphatase domain-containing protein n=1 Tax=Dreissena polymorpha TaxID=45954 RepID=A0A9D4CHP2_DREPO|nr:hypothetical protein DPMN_051338 [Dreissena polymorpha]
MTEPTRWRGSNDPSVLDLIITADENAIEEIEFQSPLGKSDHSAILFRYKYKVKLKKKITRDNIVTKSGFQCEKKSDKGRQLKLN